jgi:hypothetical protein
MRVRRELLVEQPIFAQIAAPSLDADAYLPVHPGAAAFYNGTQQSFMDKYLTPSLDFSPDRACPRGIDEVERMIRLSIQRKIMGIAVGLAAVPDGPTVIYPSRRGFKTTCSVWLWF